MKCELLIIMGTSLVVHPFASLKDMLVYCCMCPFNNYRNLEQLFLWFRVPEDCPRLLINLEKAGQVCYIISTLCNNIFCNNCYGDSFLQRDPIMALFGNSGGLDFNEKTAYR